MARKNTPHIHADLIKAWADGAIIESYDPFKDAWTEFGKNDIIYWHPDAKYRIKPNAIITVHYRTLAYWENDDTIGFRTVTSQMIADDWEFINPKFIKWVTCWTVFTYEA